MSNPILFVSLGPGDPELVTLKGLGSLLAADAVFCPGTDADSRSARILEALGVPSERVRMFAVPMSRDRSAATEAYRRVAAEAAEAHRAGLRVAFAAEGDAGFYATTDYVADFLAAEGVPSARIAGVPAFLACGALAGMTVTRLDEALEIVPGTATAEGLAARLAEGKTVVVMKPSRCEAELKRAMEALPDAGFHYFENVGTPGAEFHTADRALIASRRFPYFSLLIVRGAATPAAE
jgi:precorrin-2/cobalt-factor-2 C20-methyltransferase